MNYENKADRDRFGDILRAWAINFSVNLGNTDREKIETIRFYMSALESFDIDHVETAAKKIMLTRKYKTLPTVAEIVETITGPEEQIEHRAQIEADKIIEHLKKFGSSRAPNISDIVTRHLMENRWPYYSWASTVLDKDIKWWSKDFVSAYMAHREADERVMIDSGKIKPLLENIGG